MKEREDKRESGAKPEGGDNAPGRESLEQALGESWAGSAGAGERRTLSGAARELAKLPAETARAAIEVSAALAGVSLRVSMEFLRAVPEAARVLGADELRAWGEMGRRLAMADVETGAQFFTAGAGELTVVPREARLALLQVMARQMTLSTSIALETFRRAGELSRAVGDAATLASIIEIAYEIARRSAKHSADFLSATPRAVESLRRTETAAAPVASSRVVAAGVRVAGSFAARAGGMAADVWAALPSALEGLDAARALLLIDECERILEYGGAGGLHALVAGGEVLRIVPESFQSWTELLREVAAHGNASLVALARATPPFFQTLTKQAAPERVAALTARVISAARRVARVDAEAAISCFRSAPSALRTTTIEQFERWALEGLAHTGADARARRSYYALETRKSHEALQSDASAGLALDDVAQTLRLYVEALTGRAVEIAPLASVPDEARINDGRTIHLPSNIGEFDTDALNFRLYKVLAAHAAGQIEFGTHAQDEVDLRAAYAAIAEAHAPENLDARDAFALDGYINDLAASEPALPPEEEARRAARERAQMPEGSDFRAVLALFPQTGLATRIFGTLENGRIDRRLRHTYRGLVRDLDLIREHLRRARPRIAALPVTLVPFELLFQITLCGGALDDARAFYGQVVSELETIVAEYLASPQSTVADTLMATSRVYSLFQSVVPEMQQQTEAEAEASGEDDEAGEDEQSTEAEAQTKEPPASSEQKRDARELFNAWASAEARDRNPDDLFGAERWTQGEAVEQELEEGEVAYAYDEWDRELADMRVGWCRVIEKRVRRGERSFVELTRSRYRGVISSIRHQFQLMKPESLKRVTNELDGDDFDLSAVIDYVLDRRADGQQSERLYTKRLRRERDVAVSFLLDQSSSTARTIGRHPLQPYTHPGRRIIEVEKEGLVLMSEALEAVGDVYAIYGFTSEGRRNVKFYVVKDFDERYSEEIERRIGGINYQHNTRLGAAIRHAAERLKRQEARTRLLVVLSDGRPYDHDYGDARYAREDSRAALQQARTDGIIPFCITIDRDSETELRDLYGEVGYTIIDDVLSLPERLPAIYRRLTS